MMTSESLVLYVFFPHFSNFLFGFAFILFYFLFFIFFYSIFLLKTWQ